MALLANDCLAALVNKFDEYSNPSCNFLKIEESQLNEIRKQRMNVEYKTVK